MGAGAASEDAASGEERSGSASEEARLRSASGKAEEDDEDKEATAAGAGAGAAEPGRRRVRVSAVSSKSSPEAAEDSVDRSVSTDMAGGGVLSGFRFVWARRGRGREGKEKEKGSEANGGGGLVIVGRGHSLVRSRYFLRMRPSA